MALTPDQARAVEIEGNAMIFAGPGSGKTHTLISKAERILADPNNRLVMVTFTRKSADEMTERIAKRIGKGKGKPRNVAVGTFHSLALAHYRKHIEAQGRAIKLAGPDIAASYLNRALDRIADDDLREAVRRRFEGYQSALDRAGYLRDLDDVEANLLKPALAFYGQKLEDHGQTDLAEIMRSCALGVDSGEIPLINATHMMVDEFQDTDQIQYLFVMAHARAGVKVTVVGDDDQTIYEWRNALGHPGMVRFVEQAEADTVVLGDNFRSHEEIVEAASELIRNNDDSRVSKRLVSRRGAGGEVFSRQCASFDYECRFVAGAIERYIDEHPEATMAVLARHNYLLQPMEAALNVNRIPYVRTGGSLWQRPAVMALVGYLNAVVAGDAPGLDQAMHFAALSEQVIAGVVRQMNRSAEAFLGQSITLPKDATATDGEVFARLTETGVRVAGFLERGMVHQGIDAAASLIASYSPNHSSERRHRRDIETASNVLSGMKGKLSARLKYLRDAQQQSIAPGVPLLTTMHSSKGLEFDGVWVIGVNKDILPSKPDYDTVSERRLLYVAMTRAKNTLTVTCTAKEKSDFIGEFPSVQVRDDD